MLTVETAIGGARLVLELSGVVTPIELRRGLLAIVREDAWSKPVLWDLRRAESFTGTDADFTETVAFAARHMKDFQGRGRIAVLATQPHVKALAESYLQAWNGAGQRALMAIVETVDAAEAWLAVSPAESSR